MSDTGIHRIAMPTIFFMNCLYDRRIFLRIGICDLRGVVCRSIIHNQYFYQFATKQCVIHALLHIVLRIIAGNCDG